MDILFTILFVVALVLFLLGGEYNGGIGLFCRFFAVVIFCSIAFHNGKTAVSGHPLYIDIDAVERGVRYSTYKVPIPNSGYKYYVFVKGEDTPVFYQFASEVEIQEDGVLIRKKIDKKTP